MAILGPQQVAIGNIQDPYKALQGGLSGLSQNLLGRAKLEADEKDRALKQAALNEQKAYNRNRDALADKRYADKTALAAKLRTDVQNEKDSTQAVKDYHTSIASMTEADLASKVAGDELATNTQLREEVEESLAAATKGLTGDAYTSALTKRANELFGNPNSTKQASWKDKLAFATSQGAPTGELEKAYKRSTEGQTDTLIEAKRKAATKSGTAGAAKAFNNILKATNSIDGLDLGSSDTAEAKQVFLKLTNEFKDVAPSGVDLTEIVKAAKTQNFITDNYIDEEGIRRLFKTASETVGRAPSKGGGSTKVKAAPTQLERFMGRLRAGRDGGTGAVATTTTPTTEATGAQKINLNEPTIEDTLKNRVAGVQTDGTGPTPQQVYRGQIQELQDRYIELGGEGYSAGPIDDLTLRARANVLSAQIGVPADKIMDDIRSQARQQSKVQSRQNIINQRLAESSQQQAAERIAAKFNTNKALLSADDKRWIEGMKSSINGRKKLKELGIN